MTEIRPRLRKYRQSHYSVMWRYFRDDAFSLTDRTPSCDRQTDRQTEGQTQEWTTSA